MVQGLCLRVFVFLLDHLPSTDSQPERKGTALDLSEPGLHHYLPRGPGPCSALGILASFSVKRALNAFFSMIVVQVK